MNIFRFAKKEVKEVLAHRAGHKDQHQYHADWVKMILHQALICCAVALSFLLGHAHDAFALLLWSRNAPMLEIQEHVTV